MNSNYASGPGRVAKILGIHYRHSGMGVTGKYEKDKGAQARIWIEDRDTEVLDSDILITPRIGVDYAEEDAALPYRFQWLG